MSSKMQRTLGSTTLVVALAALSACSHAEQPHHAPSIPVRTTALQRGSIGTSDTLDGHVTPFLQSNLATEEAATVLAVYANEGDHVHKGEVLAKLDDTPLRAQLSQAQGSRVEAVAHLAQANIQEPITEQSSTSALSQARSTVIQSEKQLLTDQAAISQSKLTSDADQKLLNQGYVAEQTYRQANATYVANAQTLRIDQEKVAQARAALSEAERNMLNVPLQKQVIQENQGALSAAAGGEQLLSTQITETTLIAPYDGVVTSRLLDPGAYASQSQPIFGLAQIDPVYIDFNVHDYDLAYAHVGTAVSFSSPSVPGRVYQAKIASVDAVPLSGTLVYHTRLVAQNHDEELRGGMLISVVLATQNHNNVLLAPRAAVTQSDDGGQIFIVSDHDGNTVAKLVNVKVGLQNNDNIEVSGDGLEKGTRIIAARPDNLSDGSLIQTSDAANH